MFTPSGTAEMFTAVRLKKRSLVKKAGVNTAIYTAAENEPVFLCNFKSFLGGEQVSYGLTMQEKTAKIVCCYRPDIAFGDRIALLDKNDADTELSQWDIITPPDNVEQRGRWLQFNVKLAE